MRSTFVGFETARKGLSANQLGIDITGNNISNVSTEGYTRQRVDTSSVALSSLDSRYALKQAAFSGQGVQIDGVSQIRDSFLDKRYRDELCEVGYYDQASQIMSDIETAMDEVDSEGIKEALADFSSALQSLNGNADQVSYANILLTASRSLTQIVMQYDAKLDTILQQQKFDLDIAVDEVNSMFEQVAILNQSIQAEIYSTGGNGNDLYGPNELLDKRNLLLDRLAAYGGVKVTEESDGSVSVDFNGQNAIQGSRCDRLNLSEYEDGTISMNWQSTGEAVSMATGSLKAYQDMINGRGEAASGPHESNEQGILYYKDRLDGFSRSFAEAFNHTIEIAAVDGITGVTTPTGTYKVLFESSDGGPITAKNMMVSTAWSARPDYIIRDIVSSGESDNAHILRMISLMNENMDFGDFNGTFEAYVNSYNITIGQQKNLYSTRLEATSAVAEDIMDRRDAVSGVSIDEEGMNLMLYEKAYNAMARIMTVMDEALDTLINKTGLVGR